jgi:hypothetical protein
MSVLFHGEKSRDFCFHENEGSKFVAEKWIHPFNIHASNSIFSMKKASSSEKLFKFDSVFIATTSLDTKDECELVYWNWIDDPIEGKCALDFMKSLPPEVEVNYPPENFECIEQFRRVFIKSMGTFLNLQYIWKYKLPHNIVLIGLKIQGRYVGIVLDIKNSKTCSKCNKMKYCSDKCLTSNEKHKQYCGKISSTPPSNITLI